MRTRKKDYYPKLIAASVIFVILLAIFCKFAVIDRLDTARVAEQNVKKQTQKLDDLIFANQDYSEVRTEYEQYLVKNSTLGDSVDCMEVVALIEKELMKSAKISSVTFSSNVISVILEDINLEQASVILQKLYENELVSMVQLYAASSTSEEPETASISMTISLVGRGADEE